MLSWETENNFDSREERSPKQGSAGIQRCSLLILSPFWTNLPNHHIVGCLHDNCPKTPFHAEGCLWGTNYLPVCPSSPHPHPTPLTHHPLISVGILFWLNGLKHKLPAPTPSFPWYMSLIKDPFASMKPCSGLGTESPDGKPSLPLPEEHPLCRQSNFGFHS